MDGAIQKPTGYCLNWTVRKLLAYPMGELFTGPPAEAIPKAVLWMQSIHPAIFASQIDPHAPKIICVGDVISKAILEHPLLSKIVKFAFIDGETQRGTKIDINPPQEIIHKTIQNPRAMISDESIEFIRKHFNNPLQYLVGVQGEEDLLVLPAVLECQDCFVFYGQPPITDADPPIPAGAVGLYSSPDLQSKYQKVLDRFDRC